MAKSQVGFEVLTHHPGGVSPLQSQVTDLLATNPVPEVDGDRQSIARSTRNGNLQFAIENGPVEIVDLSIVM